MIKIQEIREFKGIRVDTVENSYSRYSEHYWTETIGESEEPVYFCEDLEKAFQEYIFENNINIQL